jgi:hypothetical protein
MEAATAGDDRATGNAPLRIGILLDSMLQPRWLYWCIELALQAAGAPPALVVINDADPNPSIKSGRVRNWIRKRHYLLHALYMRVDKLKFTVSRDPFALADLTPLTGDSPTLHVRPRQTAHSDYFEDADVDRVLAYRLDVALRFGFRILRGRALSMARHGVWSYHHGDSARYRGGPAGFWEVMEQQPVTGTVLQVLSEDLDGGSILNRSWTRTEPFSVRRNQERQYWCSAPLIARSLQALSVKGQEAVDGRQEAVASVATYSSRLYMAPRNRDMLGPVVRLGMKYVASHLRSAVQAEQWFLAYRQTRCTGETDGAPDLAPYRFTSLTPSTDRFWADPFPIRDNGRCYLFFEELVYREGKGCVAMLEFGDRGPIGTPTRVLEREYHLSYPFVFAYRGEHFLMPETSAQQRVELWRATRFPFEWTQEAEVLSGLPLWDATIAQVDSRWWLFAAGNECGVDSSSELLLYYADSPLGPWRPHRRNPLVSDVRSARPAGRLFRSHGAWFRPAQDGSRGYGSAITIQRVECLTEHEYRETSVTRLEPRWRPDLVGTHTVNAVDGLTVIDARRRRTRWSNS